MLCMYKDKYLKYKKKFIELKNNISGGGYGEWIGIVKTYKNV